MKYLALLLTFLVSGASAQNNGTLGIYADPEGTQRCIKVPVGSATQAYLVATNDGATATGWTGVEFRIEVSNPHGWVFSYSAPPNAPVVIGDPMDLAPDDPKNRVGANVAFALCQTRTGMAGDRIPVGTLLIVNQGGGPTRLSVKRRAPPASLMDPCPLFVLCDLPTFTIVCMSPCVTDPHGEAIEFQASINDPACSETTSCPVSCPEAPSVDLVVDAPPFACPDTTFEVAGRATNTSSGWESIDLYIDFELVRSFEDVAPGETVTASSSITRQNCDNVWNSRIAVGAVARNRACPDPVGAERFASVQCSPLYCNGNLPPDCSAARATISELWPPTGELVSVGVSGVTDPNGDAVQIHITDVTSDEPAGTYDRPGDTCPDAVVYPTVSVRAERAQAGNGRVYTLHFFAQEPSGLRCSGSVPVCVPRKPGVPCVDDGEDYPRYCDYVGGRGTGDRVPRLRVERDPGAPLAITFVQSNGGPIELSVYNVAGRRVRQLARGDFQAGEHSLRWDGTDASGSRVATGIYIFRLTMDGAVHTQKAVWMR